MTRRVSIVVSTYSKTRIGYVLDCLDSLKKQTLMPIEIFLIVDPDEDLANFYQSRVPPEVRVIMAEEFGLSNARNTGVKAAKGDVVAFIDDDAIADVDWLEKLTRNHDDSDVLVAGGFIKPLWESESHGWFPEELYWLIGCSYSGLPSQKTLVRNPIGCNMSFKRDAVIQAGYFRSNIGRVNTQLLSGEETEISTRISKVFPNSLIIYDPAAVVCHHVGTKRLRFDYILRRSFFGGISIALIEGADNILPTNYLVTEKNYLRNLIASSILPRIRKIYDFETLHQLATILVSVASVGIAYLLVKFMIRANVQRTLLNRFFR